MVRKQAGRVLSTGLQLTGQATESHRSFEAGSH
ncbi:hypothetical protein CEXT_417441, partial [Caerostris extrusa]